MNVYILVEYNRITEQEFILSVFDTEEKAKQGIANIQSSLGEVSDYYYFMIYSREVQ